MTDAGKPTPASLPDGPFTDAAGTDESESAVAGDVETRNKDELWVTGVWLQQRMPFWASTSDKIFVIGEHHDGVRKKCPVTGKLSVVSTPGDGPSVVVDKMSPDTPEAREVVSHGVRSATGWDTEFAVSNAI